MKHALAFLDDELATLDGQGVLRKPPRPREDCANPSFCSNDYLGLADVPIAPTAAGAGASRHLGGHHAEHHALERALADWLGAEQSLLFSSGYAANVGLLSALARPGDLVVSDALNHASIIDGARLSRARVAITPHLDISAIAAELARRDEERAWVVVESYYSMDADGPDLAALRAACDHHRAALLLDEAHALGVLGPLGRGRAAEAGVVPDALVGTLGKAFGAQGAFVAGSDVLCSWLWNRARSLVFSTGLSPALAKSGLTALHTIQSDDPRRRRVHENAAHLRDGLRRAGADATPNGYASIPPITEQGNPVLLGFGHVVPVILGPAERAMAYAATMQAHGVDVMAVRPPTVPSGTARLRLTVTAKHEASDIDRVVEAFAAARQKELAL